MNQTRYTTRSVLTHFGRNIGAVVLAREEKSLLITIAYHLLELNILKHRISDELREISDDKSYNFSHSFDKPNPFHNLMLSIHSFIVAWANIGKSLHRLGAISSNAEIERIFLRRSKWFKSVTSARNALEHIDERALRTPGVRYTGDIMRLRGRKHASIEILGNRVDISEKALSRVDVVSKEVGSWLMKQPTFY